MKKAACLVALLLTAAAFAFLPPAQAGDDAAKAARASLPNPMCPVLTDEPAEPDIYVDWNGRRVHLCCQRCRQKFLADPAAYAANLPPLPADGGARATRFAADSARRGEDDKTLTGPQRVLKLAGRFHPATVHFPIALLVVAAALEFFGLVAGRRGAGNASRRAIEAARVIVPLGAVAALLALALGLAAEEFGSFPRDMHDAIERHERLGIVTAAVAVLTALASFAAARRGGVWTVIYRVALLLVAILVGVTGFFGGVLVYGPDHYSV